MASPNSEPVPQAPQTIKSDFLSLERQPGVNTYVVVLNYALPKATAQLLKQASAFTICADGGTNRLYDSLPYMVGDPPLAGPCSTCGAGGPSSISTSGTTTVENNASSSSNIEALRQIRLNHLPDVIIGDMDSIREDVREFYSSHGVPILDESADQDSTDLGKCIRHLEAHVVTKAAGPHQIIVLGALGGRLDHTLANLSALYKHPHLDITLWGEGNLVRLVRGPGMSVIRPRRSVEGPQCGLVPLGAPVKASSTGLRWNMDALELRVGGMLSTSNVIEDDEIVVQAEGNMLWMTQVHME